eukprot:scaffold158795_cov19-Tisochrysis_lutea.AAC.1
MPATHVQLHPLQYTTHSFDSPARWPWPRGRSGAAPRPCPHGSGTLLHIANKTFTKKPSRCSSTTVPARELRSPARIA